MGTSKIEISSEEIANLVEAMDVLLFHWGDASGPREATLALRRLSECIDRIQLVRLGDLEEQILRLADETAKALGKRVRLVTQGFERYWVSPRHRAVLSTVLIHAIRNAIDHGIEDREQREAAGKDAVGTIKIWVELRGVELIIRVFDDGRGLSLDALRARGRELGLVGEFSDPNEVLELLFAPGFSTRRVPNAVSGRGVGLNAARSAVRETGGSLSVEMREGRFCLVATLPVDRIGLQVLPAEVDGRFLFLPPEQLGSREEQPSGKIRVQLKEGDFAESLECDRLGEEHFKLFRFVPPTSFPSQGTADPAPIASGMGGGLAARAENGRLGGLFTFSLENPSSGPGSDAGSISSPEMLV